MIEGLDNLLAGTGHPGLVELRAALHELLGGDDARGRLLAEHSLPSNRPRAYRLRFACQSSPESTFSSPRSGLRTPDSGLRTLVVKRLEPAIAQKNLLVSRRWLPALGLEECAPKLLGVAAEPRGTCVWHIYEDLGDGALDASAPDRPRVQAVVELIAQLHTRFADHPLLAECRLQGAELGISYFTANVSDAIRSLTALRRLPVRLSSEHTALCEGLLERLHNLAAELPERAHTLAEFGGPETFLHGDLWTTNTFTVDGGESTVSSHQSPVRTPDSRLGTPDSSTLQPPPSTIPARLIDWDHAAVGPVSYDLSTFLLRFRSEDRSWILNLYRDAVARAGWELPAATELNLLFETAEFARFANRIIWPSIALAQERVAWGLAALAEVEQWFADWSPVLKVDSGEGIVDSHSPPSTIHSPLSTSP